MKQHVLPAKITRNLLIQVVGDETLVYDERRHLAFCLDRLASAIWQYADGTRTVEDIASAVTRQLAQPVGEASVLVGLAQFERDGLLSTAPEAGNGADFAAMSTLSRRAMMGKVGLGAAMMVPVIATVLAPRAAQAASGCFDCTNSQRRHPPSQSE
jgi:hypothetical protein